MVNFDLKETWEYRIKNLMVLAVDSGHWTISSIKKSWAEAFRMANVCLYSPIHKKGEKPGFYLPKEYYFSIWVNFDVLTFFRSLFLLLGQVVSFYKIYNSFLVIFSNVRPSFKVSRILLNSWAFFRVGTQFSLGY